MLNLSSVLLEFFLPISQSLDKLEKVDIGYSASPSCRLNYDFEACLAGGQIGETDLITALGCCCSCLVVVVLFLLCATCLLNFEACLVGGQIVETDLILFVPERSGT